MPRSTTRGFTLVEMVVTVLILGVLAYVAIPRITESSAKAQVATCQANVDAMNRQMEYYFLQEGAWPTQLSDLTENQAYFPDGTPVCPVDPELPYTLNQTTHRVRYHDHGQGSSSDGSSGSSGGSDGGSAGSSGGSSGSSGGSSGGSSSSRRSIWSWLFGRRR